MQNSDGNPLAWTLTVDGHHGAYPLHPNTGQYLRIEVLHPGKDSAGVGVSNSGFAVKQEAAYHLTFHARPHCGYKSGLTVTLESKTGARLASFRLNVKDWKNQQPAAKPSSPGAQVEPAN